MAKNKKNMIEAKIHNFPGKQIRLEYSAPAEWTPSELAAFVANAVFLFADQWLVYHVADLWIGYSDIATGLPEENIYTPRPFWMLQQTTLPADLSVHPAWVNEEVVLTEHISVDSMNNWINHALSVNDSNQGEMGVCWRQIIFSASRCCTYLPGGYFRNDEITVEEEGRIFQHPLERDKDQIWITAPLKWKSLSPPIRIVIDNYAAFITLKISLYWSFWTHQDLPGTSKVDEAISRLINNGWEYASD